MRTQGNLFSGLTPLVSVIVPNYNHARFLPQRLDTIFAQTFRNFEVIVLDDLSTDESRNVIKQYAASHPMRLLFNEENSGSPFIQWQRGANLATGKYLWIAESDDYADPRLLERLVAVMEESPHVGLAYCESRTVTAEGQVGETFEYWNRVLHPTRWRSDYQNGGRDEITNYTFIQNTVPNASAVLVRREIFQLAINGAASHRLCGDWLTWINTMLRADVAFISEPLNYFRVHNHSVRATTRAHLYCVEEFAIKAHLCGLLKIPMRMRSKAFGMVYQKWRLSVRDFQTSIDYAWIRKIYAYCWTVYAPGTIRMTACLVRANAGRIFHRPPIH